MPRLSLIFPHLHYEVINIFKMCFIAELSHKLHFQFPAVQVTFKIEQMGLDQEPFTTNGRTCSKVRYTIVPASITPARSYREYALQGAGLRRQSDIGCRVAQLATQLTTLYNPP